MIFYLCGVCVVCGVWVCECVFYVCVRLCGVCVSVCVCATVCL